MKKLSFILIFTVLTMSCFAQFAYAKVLNSTKDANNGTTTVTYIADLSSVFPNPERGWHNRRDLDGRGNNDIRDFSNVKAAGNTLVHSYLRLDDFKNTDIISQSFLDDMQTTLDAIRKYGLKICWRSSYVWSESPSVPESRILKHIEQIYPVISKNADVISHLETGLLGKWGEWHSGIYTELSSRADGDTRYRIIKKILDLTPESIPLAMRYPMHIREILDELPAPAGTEPLTQDQKDRVGHHSDCFLYNDTDRGTFDRSSLWFGNQTLEQQKKYAFDMITSYGGNKFMGGETCDGMARIDATQNDMAGFNFTEINIDFWANAIAMWKSRMLPASGNDPAESEFTRISRKLGYRLRLIDATFPTLATAGGSFTFAANLNNDGFVSVLKPRPIYLVFDNGINRYNVELTNIDVRKWVSGPINLSTQTVKLPSNMVSGKYKLALWLPDASSNLQSRPEYSIRFANKEVWDAAKGYNVITDTTNSISVQGLTSIGSENELSLPTEFEVKQNYPNPFNSVTTVGFRLYNTANVDVTIYNSVGACVSRTNYGSFPAGKHKLNFNFSSFSSGVYLLKLTAGEKSKTIKMFFTK